MPDLKAAAKRLRGGDWTTPSQDRADRFLAAQALEALAWQEETGARLKENSLANGWVCQMIEGDYYADTPLGALLAAMEGEKDGN